MFWLIETLDKYFPLTVSLTIFSIILAVIGFLLFPFIGLGVDWLSSITILSEIARDYNNFIRGLF